MRALAHIAIATALVLGVASTAHAQESSNKVAAEALFDEGLSLFDRGQYPDACAKFASSQKLEPASGTLLNLGRCYEKMGKTASAWSAFRDAQALARKEGNAKREGFAKTQEAALAKRLSKMTVVVAQPVPNLEVLRDDAAIDSAVWGSAVPVDPGAHVVVAKAPGKKTWNMRVELSEAQTTVVDIPALEDETAAAPARREESAPSSSAKIQGGEGLPPTRIVAIAAAGAGVVALGVGTFFGLSAISSSDEAKPHCVLPRPCDDEGRALRDDARSQADVSTVSFIAGGVLIVTGAVLWFALPTTSSASPRARASASGLTLTF